jgi:hypothetical protein
MRNALQAVGTGQRRVIVPDVIRKLQNLRHDSARSPNQTNNDFCLETHK